MKRLRNDALVNMKRLRKVHQLIKQQLTFPIASKPLSKNKSIPRNRNSIPNPVTPIPISTKQKSKNDFNIFS